GPGSTNSGPRRAGSTMSTATGTLSAHALPSSHTPEIEQKAEGGKQMAVGRSLYCLSAFRLLPSAHWSQAPDCSCMYSSYPLALRSSLSSSGFEIRTLIIQAF